MVEVVLWQDLAALGFGVEEPPYGLGTAGQQTEPSGQLGYSGMELRGMGMELVSLCTYYEFGTNSSVLNTGVSLFYGSNNYLYMQLGPN